MKHCDDTKIEVWDLKQPKQKFSRQETCRMDHVSFCSNRLRTIKPQDDVKPPVTVRGSTSCWWNVRWLQQHMIHVVTTSDLISNMQRHSQTHLHPPHQDLQVTRVKWTRLHSVKWDSLQSWLENVGLFSQQARYGTSNMIHLICWTLACSRWCCVEEKNVVFCCERRQWKSLVFSVELNSTRPD